MFEIRGAKAGNVCNMSTLGVHFYSLSWRFPGFVFFDSTLGNSDISTFMEDANPEAFAALKNRFEALDKAGLWVTRRNSIRASLEAAQ